MMLFRAATLFFSCFCPLGLLPSCQTLAFYGQAVGGHWEIMQKSRPSPEVIADPATPAEIRNKLAMVEEIRHFATKHLSLPGEKSYGRYADLGRKHVVWVLYAAPEFSMEPKKWRYPAVGEMDYRGYFRKEDSDALATRLRVDGDDVFVGGVDAYSTLGWFHDPVLNTFVHYPEIDLAEILFHELSHQKLFRKGDTEFNESLANVVAEAGVRRWLKHHGRLDELENYEGRLVRRREFYHEVDLAKRELTALYAADKPPSEMRLGKSKILKNLQSRFLELRRRWGGRGLESWLTEEIHNGHLISLSLYYEKMPVFEKLLEDCGGDLDLFFKQASHLRL
jgi:predicted aminopeptidase